MPKLPIKIGGSMVAAVLGQSKWNTRMDAYFWLAHGKQRERSVAENMQMKLGLMLENTVAKLYQDSCAEHGKIIKLKKPKPEKIIIDDWRAMSPDFFVFDQAMKPKQELIECKTGKLMSRDSWGAEGSDYVPADYLYQVTWYNGNCREHYNSSNYTSSDIAVLLGGEDFRIYPIPFEQDLFDLMLEGASDFWKKHVVPKIPPEPDGSKLFSDHLQKRFARYRDNIIPATDEQKEFALRFKSVNDEIKRLKQEKEALQQKIQLSIGDAQGFIWYDEFGYPIEATWKAITETDWESICRNTCLDKEQLTEMMLGNCEVAWGKIAKQLNPEKEIVALYQKPGARRLKVKIQNSEA